jgi:hypothetical protein
MNFRKCISFVLALFLLVSNTGFAIDVHYCGGKIASLKPIYWKNSNSTGEEEKGCCPPKKSNLLSKKESCCKDKVVHFQKKSGKVSLNSITFQPDFVFLVGQWNPFIFSKVSDVENSSVASYYCDANAPPLFKLYNQYIFYA